MSLAASPPSPAVETPSAAAAPRAIGLETVGMTKTFGALTALDDVSIRVRPGSFHALLGENGAGKSTLVKCVMGYHPPTRGAILIDQRETRIGSPREAQALGLGMVYQHFTLVPSLTAAENLVLSRANGPKVIDWRDETARLLAFLETTPFRVPLDRPVGQLAAGERQKLEILKQLHLDQRLLILDEPTSVLTPDEADEVLGLLRRLTEEGRLTVLMITHKFREVTAYADEVTVLRRGRRVGGGPVPDLPVEALSRLMVGETKLRERAARINRNERETALEIAGVFADNDDGLPALDGVSLRVRRGEILGVAGVSGNGQSELIEVLSGQRELKDGRFFVRGEPFEPTRGHFVRLKVFGLPEEPLRNGAVPRMTVAENLAFRAFDRPPMAWRFWLKPGAIRARARRLIADYRIKTPSPEERIENLSGGNVQRAVLARELSNEVDVLIVANPCFGLDFASVAEIRAQLMDQRNRGAGVLLVSEDLDEILELADRVAVMSEGRIVLQSPVEETDRAALGRAMAAHH